MVNRTLLRGLDNGLEEFDLNDEQYNEFISSYT